MTEHGIFADHSISPDAMRAVPQPGAHEDSLADLFGPVIHTYSRADAIEDGALIAVPQALAQEAGLRAPVALTAAAWADCVAWDDDEDNHRKGTVQDETGRLWDVLYMTRFAIRRAGSGSRATVELFRVPREGRGRAARRTTLVAQAGPGDTGELVITVMCPDED